MNALQTKITRMAMLAVCSAALTAPLAVLAQDTPPPPPPPAQDGGAPAPGGHHGHGGGDRVAQMKAHEDHQLEGMTKKLNLTADQQTQIKQVFADSDAKVAALFADSSIPKEDKRSKMMDLIKERQAAIRATLTPQQTTKFDQEKAQERMHKHGGPDGAGAPGGDMGGDNPPPPPPQQ